MAKTIKDVCECLDCLTRTCGRNRVQYSRHNRFELRWINFQPTCTLYKSKNQWKTFYTPPPRDEDDYDLSEEDREEDVEDDGQDD